MCKNCQIVLLQNALPVAECCYLAFPYPALSPEATSQFPSTLIQCQRMRDIIISKTDR